MAEEESALHSMSAQEYAKIRAVLEQIAGLWRSMVVTGLVGVLISFWVWLFVTFAELLALDPRAVGVGFEYGLATFTPFIAIIGYFSYRVNKHIIRLSKGKYEPPMLIE